MRLSVNTRGTLRLAAAPSAYLVVTGVWFLLALGYGVLYLRGGADGVLAAAGIAAVVGLGFSAWLNGFLIVLEGSSLSYRDGVYRWSRIALKDLSSVEVDWIGWAFFGDRLRLPRLVVRSKAGTSIVINTKPFRRAELRELGRVLRESTPARVSSEVN
jgi:hypothetical protein